VFDTSLAYSFDIVERFVANFGAERLVFGTDMYSPPLAYGGALCSTSSSTRASTMSRSGRYCRQTLRAFCG